LRICVKPQKYQTLVPAKISHLKVATSYSFTQNTERSTLIAIPMPRVCD